MALVKMTPCHRSIRKLALRLHPATIKMLTYVLEADKKGRKREYNETKLQDFIRLAEEVKVIDEAPKPIIMGRHIMDPELMKQHNLTPYEAGKKLGYVLKEAFEAQLEGEFSSLEGALEWIAKSA